MNFKRILFFLIVGLLSCLLFISCTAPNSEEKPTALTVSAASSLTAALEAIAPLYKAENPQILITYNFGSSGSLQQQIEQGAPVDIFISAGDMQMNALQSKGLLAEEKYYNFLRNKMVLIVPAHSNAIASFQDLTKETIEKIGIGNPDSVPAGQYAEEILTYLGNFNALQSKLIFAKDVRQVLTYVETGNVDAGIVYSTDAQLSDKVKIVAIASETSHSPVVYPIAVIKSSKNIAAAQEFVDFLFSDKAKTVFQQQGFTPIKP